jgi:hypothetical protein
MSVKNVGNAMNSVAATSASRRDTKRRASR